MLPVFFIRKDEHNRANVPRPYESTDGKRHGHSARRGKYGYQGEFEAYNSLTKEIMELFEE